MAITVNYYPRMDNIAQTAYGGGQTQEGIRQQNFGLNVEQLAQRERMQDQDLGFRQGAQLFDAQVGMAQQARGIAANQQSQMYAQAGRERLAMFEAAQQQQARQQEIVARNQQMIFGAAQDAYMQRQSQQGQMSLLQAQQEGRLNEFKQKLSMEGQQRVAEYQRRIDAVNDFANKHSLPAEQRAAALADVDSWAAQTDLARFIVDQPTAEEIFAQNSVTAPDGSLWIHDGQGGWKQGQPPKVSETKIGSWQQSDGSFLTAEPGQSILTENGNRIAWSADGEWYKVDDPPQQQQQVDQVEKWDLVDKKAMELYKASLGIGSTPISLDKARKDAEDYYRNNNHPWFTDGAGQGQPHQAPQRPDYGDMPAPPTPPSEFNIPSHDGMYVYAYETQLMDSPQYYAMYDKMLPTVTSPEELAKLPVGAYFNAKQGNEILYAQYKRQ